MRLPGAKVSAAFERALPGGELPGTLAKRNAAQVAALKGDAAAAAAQDAGYALPPTQVNPGIINKVLEGAGGKIKTAQDLSTRNQPISNKLIRETFDLPPETPLSTEALAAVRKKAGQAYEPVRGAGRVTTSPEYAAALDSIEAPYRNAAKDFPDAPQSPVVDAVNSVRRDSFDSSSALDQIRIMRDKADVAYRGGDKGLGGAYKDIANTLESEIDRHLTTTGAPADVIDNFRNARQRIAQTYTVQKHLEPSGNIDAQGLARELDRKPLPATSRRLRSSDPTSGGAIAGEDRRRADEPTRLLGRWARRRLGGERSPDDGAWCACSICPPAIARDWRVTPITTLVTSPSLARRSLRACAGQGRAWSRAAASRRRSQSAIARP